MSDINKFYNLPEVSFIDGITADSVMNEMINDYQDKLYELTNEYEVLGEFDKYRILINATTLKLYQAYQYIEKTGKMNLLKYSTGDYLINLGANRSVTINEEKAAVCEVKFSLSQILNNVVSIPKGTLVTAGDGIFFETQEYVEIAIGAVDITTTAVCQSTGTIGNGYAKGQINTLVEPIPYIASVTNITVSNGGEDIQSDEDFRKKIFLAPSGYSTAGPEDAYVYWVNEYSNLIGDIKVNTTDDDTVQIIIIKKNGEIPDEEFIKGIKEFLENGNIKPQTEKIVVSAPNVIKYNILGTYYINSSDKNNVKNIQNAVDDAVNEFVKWQKDKIGRDLNPFHLQYLLMKAGVKRFEITAPVFQKIDKSSVAIENSIALSYGGIEDD